jgi:DNA-binding GntR family transcriptional regulator
MQSNALDYITIDRRSTVKYKIQLKDNIKALILDRTLYYQTSLPSEKKLAEYLGIVLSDVETAYLQLEKERFISKKKSKYQISYIELTNTFFERNTSIYDAIISLGLTPSIKCIEKQVLSLDENFIKEIGFDEKAENKYLYINRIYYGDDQPIIILKNYLPLYIFKDMDKIFKGHEPLNHYIGENYGFQAHLSKRVTKAVNIPLDISKLLNERSNASSLQSTNHVYDIKGRLIDYGQSYSISSYYFQTKIKKEEMKEYFPNAFK